MMTEVGPTLQKGDWIFNKLTGDLMKMTGTSKDLYCSFKGPNDNDPMFLISALGVMQGIGKGELIQVNESEVALYETLYK